MLCAGYTSPLALSQHGQISVASSSHVEGQMTENKKQLHHHKTSAVEESLHETITWQGMVVARRQLHRKIKRPGDEEA